MSKADDRLFSKRRRHSMRAWQNLLVVAGISIFIVFMAILSLLIPDRTFSSKENRTLAQAPKFSAAALTDGSFFRDLSSYLQDQFAGRDGWVSARLQEEKMVGRRQVGDVFLGRDNYLLESPAVCDQARAERSTAAIRRFAEAYPDLRMVMTLVPCAAAVWPEYLPKGAPVRDQLADIGKIETMLDGAVSFVELQQALHAEDGTQIYYRTDHHWTSRGALAAFQAMQGALGIEGGSYESLLVSDSFQGTLASKTGSHAARDAIEVFLPTDQDLKYYTYYADTQEKVTSVFVNSKLDENDQYQVFFGGNHPLIQIRTTADTGRNLLLFKDSYANSFVQFLLPYYDRIVVVDPRYYYDNITGLINSESITDVLFLYSMNIFAEDTSLADVLDAAGGQPSETPAVQDTAGQEQAAEEQYTEEPAVEEQYTEEPAVEEQYTEEQFMEEQPAEEAFYEEQESEVGV